MRSLTIVCVVLAASCVACGDDTTTTDSRTPDLAIADQGPIQPTPDGPLADLAQPDGPLADQTQPDGPLADQTQPDGPLADQALADGPLADQAQPDGPLADLALSDGPLADQTQPDGPLADLTSPDTIAPDTASTDMATVCNTLVNTAAVIQEENASGAPPTLNGGTIVEGTYHRTQTLYYSSPKNRYIKETITLTKTATDVYAMEFVNATSPTNPPTTEYHVNVELTLTGGANVNYAIVCGTTGTIPTTYEATATTFRLRLGPADLIYTLVP